MLSGIAAAHDGSVGQVVLCWLIQRDVIVIAKSVRPERVAENTDVFDFELGDEEMAQIAELDAGASLCFDHRDHAMVCQCDPAALRYDGWICSPRWSMSM